MSNFDYSSLPPQRFASKRFFQKDDAKRYWCFPVCVLTFSAVELFYWLVSICIAFTLIYSMLVQLSTVFKTQYLVLVLTIGTILSRMLLWMIFSFILFNTALRIFLLHNFLTYILTLLIRNQYVLTSCYLSICCNIYWTYPNTQSLSRWKNYDLVERDCFSSDD